MSNRRMASRRPAPPGPRQIVNPELEYLVSIACTLLVGARLAAVITLGLMA